MERPKQGESLQPRWFQGWWVLITDELRSSHFMALLPRTSKHPNQSGLALSWEPGSSLQTQGVPEEFTGIPELPVCHGSTFQLTAHLHGLVALCSSWERCSCIFRGVLEQGAAAASPARSSSSHVLSFSRFYTETPNFCLLIVFIPQLSSKNGTPSLWPAFCFKSLDCIKSRELLFGCWRWEFPDFAQVYVSLAGGEAAASRAHGLVSGRG